MHRGLAINQYCCLPTRPRSSIHRLRLAHSFISSSVTQRGASASTLRAGVVNTKPELHEPFRLHLRRILHVQRCSYRHITRGTILENEAVPYLTMLRSIVEFACRTLGLCGRRKRRWLGRVRMHGHVGEMCTHDVKCWLCSASADVMMGHVFGARSVAVLVVR